MPKTLEEAKKAYKALEIKDLEASTIVKKRHLAREWANFATACEKDKHRFELTSERTDLERYVEQSCLQALRHLNYLSLNDREIKEQDISDFHEITIRLATFHYKKQDFNNASACYQNCLEAQDKFPLSTNHKIYQKAGQALLALASTQLESKAELPSLENTLNAEALKLAREGLNYSLKASHLGNLESTALIGHYYNALHPFSTTLSPLEDQAQIPALQYAAKHQALRFKAHEIRDLLAKSFKHYTHLEHFYKIYTELKSHLETTYKLVLSQLANSEKQLDAFMELIDDLGFPLNLKMEGDDLFTLIYKDPKLKQELKTSLIHLLISRGFEFQMPLPYPPELRSKDYSEAKVIDEVLLRQGLETEDPDNMNKLILDYAGIDYSKGNHALFFAENPRKNKRKLSSLDDESNKKLKEEDKETEESQNQEYTQTQPLLSQNNSDASTQILADTQSLSF